MRFLSPVFAVTSFILLCGAIVLRVLMPLENYALGALGAAVLAGLAWLGINRKAAWIFVAKKSTRNGANLLFVVLLVLGILTFLNILAKEYSWRKDITFRGENSLSPQSLKLLDGLKDPVQVKYFHRLEEKEKGETLLKSYAYRSKQFEYEFIDVVRRPTLVESLKVTKTDTVVISIPGTNRSVTVDGATEEKVTNGLQKLLRNKELVVYVLTGHGEKPLAGEQEPLAMSQAKQELEKQGYTVRELNLLTAGSIPDDITLLVVAGPQKDFFPKELELLAAYFNKGGRAYLSFDLDLANGDLSRGSKQLAELVKPYGVKVQNLLIVDPVSRAANVEPSVVLGFNGSKEHPITKDLPFAAMAANFLYPLTTYFEPVNVTGFSQAPLARTNENAWAESDWSSLRGGQVSFDQGKDIGGQKNLSLAVEKQKTEGAPEGERLMRLVLNGTSNIATNSLLFKFGNRDLFLNSIGWLADDEQFLSIRPKEADDGLKNFNDGVLNLVLLFTVFFIPPVLIVSGIVVWWRRSRL
jgi:ABC-type uncharacterized transport system involved in gliding motility auxiliary subunit